MVAIGEGETTHTRGQVQRLACCDVFTFSGEAISRVESGLVPLT